ncbi:hypothetical protein EXIGLDRAFT_732753 [Exidia glandulosa HHB12029]|uniref:Aminoglycoside phosphotransferase domain-containing protein n=1 Tax=Exidia glandulosa HHB12029 TaxID=1314781 RepID=A0A165BES3_EXIGL|nr:hypothetical protein EXIGLDRAFT_732753 [Exidia glandulosa HHB12029]
MAPWTALRPLCGPRLFARFLSTTTTTYPPSHEFFNFTRCRFLYNEEANLKKRHLLFDVSELQNAVLRATGASSVLSMTKLHESFANRVFLLHLDNGARVLAKLPYARTGATLATASEVATMAFAREQLDVPVPNVLDWSTRPGNDTVRERIGSNYIIMELARGRQIAWVWDELALEQKESFMQLVAVLQSKISSVALPAYGSLYFADELDGLGISRALSVPVPEDPRFVVGPNAGPEWYKRERAQMEIDRGPWTDVLECIRAPALRERAWISAHAVQWDPEEEPNPVSGPQAHVLAIDDYLKLAPYLPPPVGNDFPALRHLDISPTHIFVTHTEDGIAISDVIDWLYTEAAPLYLQVGLPWEIMRPFAIWPPPKVKISNDASTPPPERPAAPDREAQDEYERARCSWAYYDAMNECDPAWLEMGVDSTRPVRQHPTLQAGCSWGNRPWTDHLPALRYSLAHVTRGWDDLMRDRARFANLEPVECPVVYSDEELTAIKEKFEEWDRMQSTFDQLPFIYREGGAIPHDSYDSAKEALQEMYDQAMKDLEPVMNEAELARAPVAFPFRDGADWD